MQKKKNNDLPEEKSVDFRATLLVIDRTDRSRKNNFVLLTFRNFFEMLLLYRRVIFDIG